MILCSIATSFRFYTRQHLDIFSPLIGLYHQFQALLYLLFVFPKYWETHFQSNFEFSLVLIGHFNILENMTAVAS